MGETRSIPQIGFAKSKAKRSSTLLWAVDAGIVTVAVGVPFVMGGRQEAGQLLLIIAALWMAITWGLYQLVCADAKWRFTGAEPIMLAGLALVVLQITPLPEPTLRWLSPKLVETLSLWFSNGEGPSSLGSWSYLSYEPQTTISSLIVYIAYLLVFVVTAQRITTRNDLQQVLKIVALSAAAMAAFGLLQYVLSNGRFFWFYQHPFTDTLTRVKGAFTNRNHFANFLAMGLGPLLWWLHYANAESTRPTRDQFGRAQARNPVAEWTALFISAAIIAVVAGNLLSLSRGGILAMTGCAGVAVCILFRSRAVSGRAFLGMLGAGCVAVALLLGVGSDVVANRLDNWESEARLQIWDANIRMAADYPLVGTGAGTHQHAHKMYLEKSPSQLTECTHAESSILQLASETGYTGLALAGLMALLTFFWLGVVALKPLSKDVCFLVAGIAGGLAASFLHAFVDFTWYAPGCAVITVLLVCCAGRLYQLEAVDVRREWAVPKSVCVLAVVALMAGGSWMVSVKIPQLRAEPYWHEYLRLTLNATQREQKTVTGEPDEEAAFFEMRKKMQALMAAAKRDKSSAAIQLRAALGLMDVFHVLQARSENPLSLAQIRDAAIASNFQSEEDLHQWLDRAIGSNRNYLVSALAYTRRGLQLGPLQGEGYLYLSELGFLDPETDVDVEAYLAEALKTRPHDPQVHFVAGREMWGADPQKALEHWKITFNKSVEYQYRLIAMLAPLVPPQFFVEAFSPDWFGLNRIRAAYMTVGKPAELNEITQILADSSVERAQAQGGEDSVKAWLLAYDCYAHLGQLEQVRITLDAALERFPNHFELHNQYGRWLYSQQEYAAAAEHLSWCAKRRPGNESLQKFSERATKLALQGLKQNPKLAEDPGTGRRRG